MPTTRPRKNTRVRDTSAARARKDKDPRYQRLGASNGSYKGGNSAHAYRLKAKAKPHEVVHHKDHNKQNSTPKNLKVLTNTKKLSAAAKHNKAHPEKGRKGVAARKKKR